MPSKRRSKLQKRHAEKRAAKAAGMTNPAGESKYALKKKGVFKPQPDPHRRPSWFQREGLDVKGQNSGYHDGIGREERGSRAARAA